MEHASEFSETRDRALRVFAGTRQRLTIGISDRVAGRELPALIPCMDAQAPQLSIDIRIRSTGDLLQTFGRREPGAVIVRLHNGRGDGEVLTEEKMGRFCFTQGSRTAGRLMPSMRLLRFRLPSGAQCELRADDLT